MHAVSNAARRRNLRRLLRPQNVALVGGRSLAPSITMLQRAGYEGSINIVNPTHAEIAGIRCVPSIDDLPVAPDAAFLNVNRHLTIDAVQSLAQRGAGGAVCFAAGFGEMGGDGKSLESQLIAAAGDLAIVGPNSNGLLNRLDRLALWPMADHEPFSADKGVAFISQSGGVAYTLLRDRRDLRPAVIASTGNQILLDAADWLAVLGDDPRITAIGLFLEGPGDVAALSAAAKVTRERNMPVVVLKSGRSALGAELALTHTGSMAGDDDLFNALCDRLGFIRVATLPQLIETLKALDAWGGLRGNRMAVLTASGAARALFADAAADVGVALPAPSPAVAKALRPQLPEFAHVSNPLDHNAAYSGMVGLTLENEPALHQCFETMLSDGYDVGVLNTDGGGGAYGSPSLRAWIQAAKNTGTPAAIVATMPDYVSPDAQKLCRENGLVALQGLEDAVFAISAAARHGARACDEGAAAEMALPRAPARLGASSIVDEWKSKSLLVAVGIPFPRRRLCAAGEVAAAGAEIGFPVVLKAVSASVPHKNKLGAVAVGISDDKALAVALSDMQAALHSAGVTPDGFLVEEMIGGASAEIIIGVKHSPIYGHALLIGAGGVHVEQHGDAGVLLLPVSRDHIDRAISRLHGSAQFADDVKASLADIAEALATYAMDNRATLVAVEVNPVIVTRKGRVVAVDALIETQAAHD